MNIHITGGFGFIGSHLIKYLNNLGIRPIIYDLISDDSNNFSDDELKNNKWKNIAGLDFSIAKWDANIENDIDPITENQDILIELAAHSSTSSIFNRDLMINNVLRPLKNFSKRWGKIIYASSGATYGNTSNFEERISGLNPLNPYGFSKLTLDNSVFNNRNIFRGPIYGLRFFNVYGKMNEKHKGDMRSFPYRCYNEKGVGLFNFPKETLRDFVYVGDVCDVINFFIENDNIDSGIYNVGTGNPISYMDIIKSVNPKIEIKRLDPTDKMMIGYQDYTCADITKLRMAGYDRDFKTVAEVFEKKS